jgi:DNA-binding Lrp family transcriptional regulator
MTKAGPKPKKAIISELTKQPLFELKKPQRTELRASLKVDAYGAILNPALLPKLTPNIRYYFVFVDHASAEAYRACKAFLEKPQSGVTAVYYTVSWYEVICQFSGTKTDLTRFVDDLVTFVKKTTNNYDLFTERNVECFELTTPIVINGKRVSATIDDPNADYSDVDALLHAYSQDRIKQNTASARRLSELKSSKIILDYVALRDFVKAGAMRTVVLLSYLSRGDVEKQIFTNYVLKKTLEAYAVDRRDEIAGVSTTSEDTTFKDVKTLAIVETEGLSEFRDWMDEVYQNASGANLLPFILGKRVSEVPKNLGFASAIDAVIEQFSQSIFELGKAILPNGKSAKVVGIPRRHLIENCLIVGESGSGKTTAMIQLVRSAARHRIKSILLDVKGDLHPEKLAYTAITANMLLPEAVQEKSILFGSNFSADINIVPLASDNQSSSAKVNISAFLNMLVSKIEDKRLELSDKEKEDKVVRYLIVLDEFHKYKTTDFDMSQVASALKMCRSKGIAFVMVSTALRDFDDSLLGSVSNWLLLRHKGEKIKESVESIIARIDRADRPYNETNELSGFPDRVGFMVSPVDNKPKLLKLKFGLNGH